MIPLDGVVPSSILLFLDVWRKLSWRRMNKDLTYRAGLLEGAC